jgi:hypothetical protein
MTDPSAGLAPIKAAGQESINRSFAAAPDNISRTMASRGYGSSGDFGTNIAQAEYARSGQQNDLNSQIAQMILAQKNQGASLSEQLLGMTRSTTQNTTGTGPGSPLSDTFQNAGSGLNNIATLMTLSKLLKPGGYNSAPAYNPGSINPGIPGYSNPGLPIPPSIAPQTGGYGSQLPGGGGNDPWA